MSKELEQALIFFAGVVVGGFWVYVVAIWLWLGEKHYPPSIHTCSKHNYTGTKECPDCKQEE